MNNQIFYFNELNDLILLNIQETQTQKLIKKVLFIIISIIIPILEIICLAFQTIDYFEHNSRSFVSSNKSLVGFFSLSSLFCTWAMISVCYLEKKCIRIMLSIKLFSIIITLFLIQSLELFGYYLVFNTLGYGIFFTLIILYKIFPKGII